MGYLPMDIIYDWILPKLPAKSLIRFKCVSKSFLAEISSLKFIKQHHNNAISSDSNRLLILPTPFDGIEVYDLDSPHSPPSFCPYPEAELYPFMSVVSVCQGYLLLANVDTLSCTLFLLNPFTRTYRKICCKCFPNRPNDTLYGMWHCLDEYKVVRFVNFVRNGGRGLEVMVYNTTTNTCKIVNSRTDVDTFVLWDDAHYARTVDNTPVLVQNHLLHLLLRDLDGVGIHKKRIGCFDMKAERWANDVQLPYVLWAKNGLDFSLRTCYYLGELDNQLCFSGNNVIESTFELWIMKEYGVKESWVKLVSLCVSSDPAFCLEFAPQKSYHPLAYHTRSRHTIYLQYCKDSKLYKYDLRDKKVVEVEFTTPLDGGYRRIGLIYICNGSLLDFPGGQPIRKSLEIEEDDDYEHIY